MSKELTTEELLSKATARPFCVRDVNADSIGLCLAVIPQTMVVRGDAVCLVAPMTDCTDRDRANAELICRAVGSFEAMREALQAAHVYPQPPLVKKAIEAALALADAKQPSPQLISR